MDTALRDRLVQHAATLGTDLTPEVVGRIEAYLDLLRIWNRTTRLTGPTDERTLVERHVLDSIAVAAQLQPDSRFVDIGSGAGFPGMVLAMVRPNATAFLVEPRRRRASFLSEVARAVKLPGVTIVCARAEELRVDERLAGRCDVAVSRAIRSDEFLPLAAPLIRIGGIAIVMQTEQQARASIAPSPSFDASGSVDYELPGAVARRLLLYRRVC